MRDLSNQIVLVSRSLPSRANHQRALQQHLVNLVNKTLVLNEGSAQQESISQASELDRGIIDGELQRLAAISKRVSLESRGTRFVVGGGQVGAGPIR